MDITQLLHILTIIGKVIKELWSGPIGDIIREILGGGEPKPGVVEVKIAI